MMMNMIKLKSGILIATLFFIPVFLTGCGAGKTIIYENEIQYKSPTLTIASSRASVQVPSNMDSLMQEQLLKLLYDEGYFEYGPGLKLVYRVIQYNSGSQFTRWFWGGIGNAGEGSLTIEVKYFDDKGTQVGKIQSEGKIGSGLFGGAFDLAVEKATEEIASYTINNFSVGKRQHPVEKSEEDQEKIIKREETEQIVHRDGPITPDDLRVGDVIKAELSNGKVFVLTVTHVAKKTFNATFENTFRIFNKKDVRIIEKIK